MKIRPMLGTFSLDDIEFIESSERRALVEHKVPGLEGSYFQDLGSVPNTIVITGTKHGDEQRDTFLEGIRELFNAGEPTTFVADINTATDLTDVLIEDLQMTEVAGSPDTFRYLIKLRKYIEPPEPPATGLLDTGILDDALKLTDALDLIDAFGSIPNLGNPTEPLRGALEGIQTATGGMDETVNALRNLFGEPGAETGPEAAPGTGPAVAGRAAEEGTAETVPSAADLRIDPEDPRIDEATGATLQNMLEAPETADTAATLIQGINGGALAGILAADSAVARQLAGAHGTEPSLLVPAGQDAALVLDVASPLTAPPTVILRSGVRDDPARLGAALEDVGQTFELFQRGELGPCDSTPSAIPVPNLVPSAFCRVPIPAPVAVEGAPAGAEEAIAEEPEVIDPSAPDLQIDPQDPRIDVGAKSALQRMLKIPDMAADAARLIRGIHSEALAGIFGDDLGKAVEVARAHGTQRWLLVPEGEDAALVLDAATPLEAPPTVIFRGDTPDIREIPTRIDPALQEASRTFALFQQDKLAPCTSNPSAIALPNLVPTTFCRLPGRDLLVIVTAEVFEPSLPGIFVSGARVQIAGTSPSSEITAKLTNAVGQALFSDLVLGSYAVTASKEGFEETHKEVFLKDDEERAEAFADAHQPTAALGGPVPLQLKLTRVVTQLILIEHPDQSLPKAPELTAAARWGVLRKGGVPAGATTPLPDIPAWQDVSVRIARPQGLLLFPVDPDLGGNPLNGEATIHTAAGNEVSVISKGVHKALIHWHITSDKPIGTVAPAQEARLTGRVRFSLWADPNHITENNMSKGANKADDIVDDLSLLITVQNDTQTKIQPAWDVGLQPGTFTQSQIITFYKKIIDLCHTHKIQVLAGFGLVDRGKPRIKRFDKWLNDMTTHSDGGKAEATRFANALVTFIDSKLPGFDGISFDIESIGLFSGSPLAFLMSSTPPQGKVEKLRKALRFFYHAVADRLTVDNRVCAITVGGMMSDDLAAYGKNQEQALNLPPGTGLKTVKNAKVSALPAARLHTYDLPIGKPNIIIRPMGYDNAGGAGANAKIKAFNSDPGQFEWHKAIVEFALQRKRINPQQFQLGIKDFRPRDNVGNETGQGGTVPEPDRILHRCTEILRPNRVGLTLFAMFKPPSSLSLGERWDNNAKYNQALNADPSGNPIPRPRKGQPLQVPLLKEQAK